ncbi:FkbM family methyltransferase [Glaciecola petra]|uniref:FkbM family methyltransferase n=1 Tax=Glaciecola petra TaxID=3075602 RepID=A0ABU2ZMJ7_9ALTE|nr:FkbM family methyltransferase [Aestuariibacter sp. P117]MDT0593853.1 FkbM family methyltransferase [Aestuariibacter sp. P117]
MSYQYTPLESLVSDEEIKLSELVQSTYMNQTEVQIRGSSLRFNTVSKRTLWQAVGIDKIEPELLNFIDKLPIESVFFDIGASNGIFSVYAASQDLNVYSFEPEAANFSLLAKNCFLNNKNKHPIKAFNLAISNSNKIDNMYVEHYEAGAHNKILGAPKNVGAKHAFKPEHQQACICNKLDDLISLYNLPVPYAIKIDVDGAEMRVIEGSKYTLQNELLNEIFIEINESDANDTKAIEILNTYGFEVQRKTQVQHYEGLFNYELKRAI